MSNNINALQNQLDGLVEDIKVDSDLILGQIDMEQLIADPENYIREFATEFVHQHEAEIARGLQIGRNMARKILKECGHENNDKS